MKKVVVLILAFVAIAAGIINLVYKPQTKPDAPFTKVTSTITITPAVTTEAQMSSSGTGSSTPTLVPPGTQIVTIADTTLGKVTVKMTAAKEGMSPGVIRAKVKQKVLLEITSTDADYAFALKNLNVMAAITPGKKLILEVVPDRTGTFRFECFYKCGTITDLKAALVVE